MRVSYLYRAACVTVAAGVWVACGGSSDTDVQGQPAGDAGASAASDAGGGSDTGTTDPASDAAAGSDGAKTGDAQADGAPKPDGGCAPLVANPADVYVDQAAPAGGNGTAACPFTTITQALALPAPTGGVARTVHVAGSSTAAMTYAEPATLVIPRGVTVRDEGGTRDKTSITVKSDTTCVGTERCAVFVNGGAIEGFTVSASPHDGIATQGSGAVVPALTRMKVTGSSNDGIVVSGPATLVAVDSVLNRVGNGLVATGSPGGSGLAALTVGPDKAGVASRFDQNGASGMVIGGGILLAMTGGSASGNTGTGIALRGATGFGAALTFHTLTGVSTNGNGKGEAAVSGVEVGAEASAKLRACTSVGNSYNGVTFFTNDKNTLDLGTPASPGCNAFMADTKNNHAAVCVQSVVVLADATVKAAGDAWSTAACPAQSVVSHCYQASGYSDVNYAWPSAAAGKAPVDGGGLCTKPGSC